MGYRGHQLLRAHTGGERRQRQLAEAEAAVEPGRRRLAQRRAAGRRRVAPLGPRGRQGLDHRGQRGVAGRADGAVHHPPGLGLGQLGQAVQPVVGVGRQAEGHEAATNSAKRARPTSSSTTWRVADSSPSSWPTTSPSRWMAARTSPARPGHHQLHHPVRAAQAVGHHSQQLVDALAGPGGNEHRALVRVGQRLGLVGRHGQPC